jgi:hypothetical protein
MNPSPKKNRRRSMDIHGDDESKSSSPSRARVRSSRPDAVGIIAADAGGDDMMEHSVSSKNNENG